jgi:hypothetical protein
LSALGVVLVEARRQRERQRWRHRPLATVEGRVDGGDDRDVPMLLRMFEKRLRGYRAIGYARGEAPLGYAEPGEDLIVEYDDDVIRTLDHESATDRSDELAEWVP